MTSTLYEMYQKEKEQCNTATLLAMQAGNEMAFLGEDAITASEALNIECQSYQIAKGKKVPYLGIPMEEIAKAFCSLIDQGITIAVAIESKQ